MKIAVIGLGSMGKRRIRLLQGFDPTLTIYGVDTSNDRRVTCENETGIKTAGSLTELGDKADCAFVCTSPLSHNQIITQCLDMNLHVFTELNLVSEGYDENTSLAEKKGLVLFISSTFLYRAETNYIIDKVHDAGCPVNYTYHIGQYLPDWHPWEDYRNFFVADKKTNACREIFAIELPWLTAAFGEIADFRVVKNKISGLELDYCDNYMLMVEHGSRNKGVLSVDVVSRKAVRNLEVFGEKLYMHWDGSPRGLYLYDYDKKTDNNVSLYEEIYQLENYSSFVVENSYLNEIKAFLSAVQKGEKPRYDFKKDRKILNLIDRIEG